MFLPPPLAMPTEWALATLPCKRSQGVGGRVLGGVGFWYPCLGCKQINKRSGGARLRAVGGLSSPALGEAGRVNQCAFF
jgi:hypothetical protein